jgi:hypothetical protein
MLPRPVGSLAAILSLALPASGVAQQVTTSQNVSISVRGIFSGSLYAQDATFGTGNGQKAQYVTGEVADWFHGGDVRNMRLTLGLTGPEIKTGWRGNATFEMDFFGAFTSGGNFGDEQPQPRLRLAYVDLTTGRNTWRVGQDWSLTLGNIPQSTSHVGFPLGWGSGGFIGWRFMQVKMIRTLSAPNAPTTTRLQVALLKGSWNDGETGGGDDTPTEGERSLMPQIEGRVDFSSARWSAYVAGHVDTKDSINVAGDKLTSWALEGGFSTTRGDLSIQGNAHVSRGMGHQFAQIVQFGDIGGWGAWAQVGYNLSPRWGVWGFYGTERPNENDLTTIPAAEVTDATGAPIAVAARRFSSWLFVPMIRYRSGPYALGLEWLHNDVQVGPSANNKTRSGNQVLLSARYDF